MIELGLFPTGFKSISKVASPSPAPALPPLQDHGDSRKVSMKRALEKFNMNRECPGLPRQAAQAGQSPTDQIQHPGSYTRWRVLEMARAPHQKGIYW